VSMERFFPRADWPQRVTERTRSRGNALTN
jgi:hypothetical protein